MIDDEEEEPTTRRDSGALAVFENACIEIVNKLRGDPSDRAQTMRTEAELLIEVLRAWKREPPTADKRAARVTQVIALHRSANDYAGAKRS